MARFVPANTEYGLTTELSDGVTGAGARTSLCARMREEAASIPSKAWRVRLCLVAMWDATLVRWSNTACAVSPTEVRGVRQLMV